MPRGYNKAMVKKTVKATPGGSKPFGMGSLNLQGSSPKLQGSFKKGGKVKKTGAYKLHKGEKVMTVKAVKKMAKKKAKK